MIHVERQPCIVKGISLLPDAEGPILEVRLSLPDVDPSALVGLWPDIEAFCETGGRFDVRCKAAGHRVSLALSSDGYSLETQAELDGRIVYERCDGTGLLGLTLRMRHESDVPAALLLAIWASIESAPDAQPDLFEGM